MSNGLLQGVSEGLRLGLQGFIGERDRRDKRALQEQELAAKKEEKERALVKESLGRDKIIADLVSQGFKTTAGEGLLPQTVGDQTLYYDPSEMLTPKQKAAESLKRAQALAGMRGTPGQQAADKVAGEQYAQYRFGGGQAGAQANLDKIQQAAVDVSSGNVTGGLLGAVQKIPVVGEGIVGLADPKRIATKQNVDSVVVQSLKDTFGGNPTEGERTALLQTVYDPMLPEEIIQDRLLKLGTVVAKQKQAKDAAADFFEKNGTMRGYQGPKPVSFDQFLGEVKALAQSQGKQTSGLISEAKAEDTGEIESAKRRKEIEDIKKQLAAGKKR
jgi:hypothetical protein